MPDDALQWVQPARTQKEKGRLPAPPLQLRKETAAERCPVISGTSQPRQVSVGQSCNPPRAASPSLRSTEHREQLLNPTPASPPTRFACSVELALNESSWLVSARPLI